MVPPRRYPIGGPSAGTIRALLSERVHIGRDSVGYVALVRDTDGPRLVTYGTTDGSNSHPLDGDTVFEIGSITKVFTALMLADMVARGEVALIDPVEKYLPPEGRPKSFTTPRLGRHLLNANIPLPTLHRQVLIDPGKLSAYTGRYPLTPHFMLTVTRTGS